MRATRFLSLAVCVIVMTWGHQGEAAIFSGIIKSISVNQKQVVIQSSQGKEKSFSIPDSTATTFNGKQAKFDQFQVGQRATVFTSSSGTITRFSVRQALTQKSSGQISRGKENMKAKEKSKLASPNVATQQWSQFRGPGRANISTETGLLKDWDQNPPKLL